MKDSLNFLLPIMEDETSVISNRNELGGLTNISSNGYYGYQPVVGKHIHSNEINRDQSMEVQMSDSDIQFNNLIPSEENNQNKQMMDYRGQLKRKRCWGYDYETEYPEFKKWRESESEVISPTVPTPTCQVSLRKPTHNVPDLPRCLSGHYI